MRFAERLERVGSMTIYYIIIKCAYIRLGRAVISDFSETTLYVIITLIAHAEPRAMIMINAYCSMVHSVVGNVR